MKTESIRGRGTAANPGNRFETVHYDPVGHEGYEYEPDEDPSPQTQFFRDNSKSILTHNDSPDVGFDTSINSYRGCEHGCIYCYARPTHEYLGFSAGLDFETKIMVKENAPELLRKEMSSKKWVPRTVAMSGVTDCYQPIERKLKITRSCLEVFAEFRNPVGIVTKNFLVTRDIDLLQELAKYQCVVVFISVTSLRADLARKMEPRTATPQRRLEAIRRLHEAGIPVGVLMCPVIPGLTDHELPSILEAAAEAGAQSAGYNILRLPYTVKDLFVDWIETHYPEKQDKVLNKLHDMRGGKLYDADFANRMRGQGAFAAHVAQLFEVSARRHGLWQKRFSLSTDHFRRVTKGQMALFD